jgi:hypothetical protein
MVRCGPEPGRTIAIARAVRMGAGAHARLPICPESSHARPVRIGRDDSRRGGVFPRPARPLYCLLVCGSLASDRGAVKSLPPVTPRAGHERPQTPVQIAGALADTTARCPLATSPAPPGSSELVSHFSAAGFLGVRWRDGVMCLSWLAASSSFCVGGVGLRARQHSSRARTLRERDCCITRGPTVASGRQL